MAHLQEWAKDMSAKELDAMFKNADITSAIVATPKDLIQDKHLWEAGFLQMMQVHGLQGEVPYIGLPFKLSEHPDVTFRAAPGVGENDLEIYHNVLGYSDEKINSLHARRIL